MENNGAVLDVLDQKDNMTLIFRCLLVQLYLVATENLDSILETIFDINGENYCNLNRLDKDYITSSSVMTVTFKTKDPGDMFHLIYTNVYDKAPPTITQKAGDIIGITFDF
jgi:hypothetical protein